MCLQHPLRGLAILFGIEMISVLDKHEQFILPVYEDNTTQPFLLDFRLIKVTPSSVLPIARTMSIVIFFLFSSNGQTEFASAER